MNCVEGTPGGSVLARAFSTVVRDYLTEEELTEVVRRNASPEYADCCATHDFTDMNMGMLEAFEGFDLDGCDEDLRDLWNSAWAIAKAADFDPRKIKAVN